MSKLDQQDICGSNDCDQASVYVRAVDIAIDKSACCALPNAGSQVSFEVKASNNGPDDASGVVVEDTLPAGLEFVSSDPSEGVEVDGQTITWTVGDLEKDASATLTITARVTTAGTLTNKAEVKAVNQCDTDSSNDSDEASVSIAKVTVGKFYDANVNGVWDTGEPELGDWMFRLAYDLDAEGTESGWTEYGCVDSGTSVFFCAGTAVKLQECASSVGTWVATTATEQSTIANVGENCFAFGNVCLGCGGGKTLGFWSNKNGKSYVGEDDLATLRALNLRDAYGKAFDPNSYEAFRTWLLNGNATNMAYMLSVQLAAMKMNVYNGFVSGSALVYAPGLECASALGFISVNDLVACANHLLEGADPLLVLSDSDQRSRFEAVKDALDKANNNLIFVQPTPCPYAFTCCQA